MADQEVLDLDAPEEGEAVLDLDANDPVVGAKTEVDDTPYTPMAMGVFGNFMAQAAVPDVGGYHPEEKKEEAVLDLDAPADELDLDAPPKEELNTFQKYGAGTFLGLVEAGKKVTGEVGALMEPALSAAVDAVAEPVEQAYWDSPLAKEHKLWINMYRGLKAGAKAGGEVVGTVLEVIFGYPSRVLGTQALRMYDKESYDRGVKELEDVGADWLHSHVLQPQYIGNVIGRMSREKMAYAGQLMQQDILPVLTEQGNKKLLRFQEGGAKDPYMDLWASLEPGDVTYQKNSEWKKQAGYWMEGLAPATGFMTSIVAEYFLNPASWFKLAGQTKKGIDAAKMGIIEDGIAKAAQEGKRALLQFSPEVPFLKYAKQPRLTVIQGEHALKFLEDSALKIENTPGFRWIRNFTTKTGVAPLDQSIDIHDMSTFGADVQSDDWMWSVKTKWKSRGVDLTDDAINTELGQYAQAPLTQKLSGKKMLLSKEQKSALFVDMVKDYETWARKIRNLGEDLGEFKPEPLQKILAEPGKYAERYFPTGSSPSNLQIKKLKEVVKNEAELADIIKDMPYTDKGMKIISQNPYKEKTKFAREYFNKVKSDQTNGLLQEFFYNDPVMAAAEKTADLKKIYANAIFKKSVKPYLLDSAAEWEAFIIQRRKDVAKEAAEGIMSSASDLRFAHMSWSKVRKIRGNVPGVSGKYMPHSMATAVEMTLGVPNEAQVLDFLGSYARVLKANWFASPGYIMRNMYESAGRYMAAPGGSLWGPVRAWFNLMYPKGTEKKMVKLNDGKGTVVSEYSLMNDFYQAGGSMSRGTAELFSESGPKFGKTNELIKESFEKLPGATQSITAQKTRMLTVTESGFVNTPITVAAENLHIRGPMEHFASIVHRNSMSGRTQGILKQWRGMGLVDNPAYRAISLFNEGGETAFRYANYRDLRVQGWTHEAAMMDVNRLFMNYRQTKGAVRAASNVFPFINYQIKNVESFLKIFSQAPGTVALVRPGGAIERAMGDWTGFSPGAQEMVKELSPYYAMSVPGFFMPGIDSIKPNQDYVRHLLGKWLGDDVKDRWLMWRLPSFVHGLSVLSPEHMMNEYSPFIKAGFRLSGYDPVNNRKFNYSPEASGILERVRDAFQQDLNPARFQTLSNLLQSAVDKAWPEYVANIKNYGHDPETIKATADAILKFTGSGKNILRIDDSTTNAMVRLKTMWLGGTTRLEMDFFYRTMADVRNMNQKIDDISRHILSGDKEWVGIDVLEIQGIGRRLRERSQYFNEVTEAAKKLGDQGEAPLNVTEYPQPEPEPPPPETPESDEETDSYLEEKYQEALDYFDPEAGETNSSLAPLKQDIKAIDKELNAIMMDNTPNEEQVALINQLKAQKINLLQAQVSKLSGRKPAAK